MATKHQIERLSARIEALAAANEGGPAFVWRHAGESEEQALARHYQSHPDDRRARLTYLCQWAGEGRQ